MGGRPLFHSHVFNAVVIAIVKASAPTTPYKLPKFPEVGMVVAVFQIVAVFVQIDVDGQAELMQTVLMPDRAVLAALVVYTPHIGTFAK